MNALSEPITEPKTLKQKVAAFWQWYAFNAARFLATIDDKRCPDLDLEVNEAVDRWLTGMGWVFGPAPGRKRHSFTLTGEGVLDKQFVAEYWLSQAPVLESWTFYASRQPSETVENFSLVLDGDHEFAAAELWIHPEPNSELEKFDITACHPLSPRITEESSYTALFLLLDEVLGEHGTGNWIGEIRLSDDRLKESMPLCELRQFIHDAASERGWKKHKRTDCYTGYSRKKTASRFPRDDIYTGTTRHFDLVTDYQGSNGKLAHPLPGLGVDYLFVSFASAILPKGSEVAYRSDLEDAISAALEADSSGTSLGGAMGNDCAYMDFMIYDGENSLNIIKSTLAQLAVPGGCTIRYFTMDKGAQVHWA